VVSPKVEIKGLSKRFGEPGQTDSRVVLDNIDLKIRSGEFICLTGPSGCGKTTLLRILGGLLEHSGGQVLIDGRPITGPGPERGFVFQEFNLFPWRNVVDNVGFGLELQGLPKAEVRQKAAQMLGLVNLDSFANHYPHQISGGMKQRVGIARALVINPDILLMDEPFGALDAMTRETLQISLLKLHQQMGKTVIFVTHSVDEAILLADRVVVMSANPGKIGTVIDVDLPRERWNEEVRFSVEAQNYRHRLWNLLFAKEV
jgi:NitT/TauT family transport system ATP-binding protein